MKVLSLFDGIACGRVALERAGIPVESYTAYEIESAAVKVAQKNYPDIIQRGDVLTADFTQYKGVDLLIGGSPCQSLSIVRSQEREHLNGKSKLFFEFVRALNEAEPKYFLFENVASMNDKSKAAISHYLGCEPIYINSGDFCAQQRPRLYWTNINFCKEWEKSSAVIKDIMQQDVPEKYYINKPYKLVDKNKQVCAIIQGSNNETNNRVFNPEHKVHTLLACTGGNHQKKILTGDRVRKLTPTEYERLQTLPDDYTAGVCDTARYTALGNGWTVDVIAHILKGLKEQ